MIYASILICVILAYIVERGKPKIISNMFFAFLVIFMVFVTGMRAEPSHFCDETLYRASYMEKVSLPISEIVNVPKEKGWWILNWFLANIFPNPQTIILVSAFVTHFCSMMALKGQKHFAEGVYLYFVVGHFWASTNGMRQYFVIGILLLTLPLIAQKKCKSFFLIVVLLSTIHVSVLIMIPIYYLCQLKVDKKWIVTLSIGISMSLMFFDIILSMFEGTIYNEYYVNRDEITGTGIPRIVVWVLVTLFILKYRTSLIRQNKFYNVCIHWSLLASAILVISRIFKVIGRFNLYFSIAYLIILPVCFDKISHNFNRKIGKFFIYGLFFIYYLYELRNYNYTNVIINWWCRL